MESVIQQNESDMFQRGSILSIYSNANTQDYYFITQTLRKWKIPPTFYSPETATTVPTSKDMQVWE